MRPSLALAVLALLAIASTPPRPATVAEAGADDGQLRIHPPIARLEIGAGDGATIPLQLRNGTDRTIGVVLAAVAVEYAEDGRPVPTERTTGAAGWVSFAEEEVTLPPGGQATVRPAVNVPVGQDGDHLVAIRASSTGQAAHALIAIGPGGARGSTDADVRVERVGGRSELVTSLHNVGAATAVVTVRSVVSSWTGRVLVDEGTGPVVVPAGRQRQVRLGFRTPRLPAPYDVSAAITAADGTVVRVSTRFVAWDPGSALAAAAGALVLAAAWAWWRVVRRRASYAGSATDG